MSDNDHEHRAYQVWDGASARDIDRLESRIESLQYRISELEDRLCDVEQVVPDVRA